MTAVQARRLAEASADDALRRAELVEAVIQTHHRAIAGAAKKGRREIAAHEVDKLRTPVGPGVYDAVYARLRADGFTVIERVSPSGLVRSVSISW